MDTTFTITIDIADVIPAVTGTMIFISVLLAGTQSVRRRLTAWILGASSQLLLVGFGVLTGHYGFGSHLVVAGAFAFNIWRSRRKLIK